MVTLQEIQDFVPNPPIRQIPTTFEGLLRKLDEQKDNPKNQIAMIDYWIGMLLLTRARLQTQG